MYVNKLILSILVGCLSLPAMAINDLSEVESAFSAINNRVEALKKEEKTETRAAKVVILLADVFSLVADVGEFLEDHTKINAETTLDVLEQVNKALGSSVYSEVEKQPLRNAVHELKVALETLKVNAESMLSTMQTFREAYANLESQISEKYPEAKMLPLIEPLMNLSFSLVRGFESYGIEALKYVDAVNGTESAVMTQAPQRQESLDDLRKQNQVIQEFQATDEFSFDGMKEKFDSISTTIKIMYKLD